LKKLNNITVNFKKLSKKAVIPSYAHPTDAGADLIAVSKSETDRYIEYGLGFSTEIPEGWCALIFPNSRISKYDLHLANSVGVIDSHYRDEWKVRFKKSL
jgi:dUTP pyrophosphatase